MTAAIAVDDVHKRFRLEHDRASSIKATVLRGFRKGPVDEFWALRGVSLDVPHGSTFGLVGHNGSGKSTLLKCMAKILRPDQGSIAIDGRMSALLELGAGFHPELSGRENVYLNASILGMSSNETRRRFDDIVEFAGLEQFIDAPVKNYSSGMYVRLGFAVAINVEPEVLLVDEVLSVGDEQFQQRCLAKFADFRRQGLTVVIVSHGLGMIRSLCDRAAWLDHGILKEVGDADDVVDAYLTHVRNATAPDEQPGYSVGGGVVTSLSVHAPDGREIVEMPFGDPVQFRAELDRGDHELPEKVALVLEVRRSDSVLVSRSTIDIDPEARGSVSYDVPALRLIPSNYSVVASIVDARSGKLARPGEAVVPLRIAEPGGPQRFGVLDLGGEPSWSPAP